MKFLTYFERINPRIWKGIVFGEVLVVAVMIFMAPKEACALCTQYYHPCPASIVVWGDASIPYVGIGNGTLPNGHAYCKYGGWKDGDFFTGSFDKVAGKTVTFARTVNNCVGNSAYYDYSSGDGSGFYYPENTYYTCDLTTTAVPMNPLNYGAKCVNTNYFDPYYSGSAGTDSNYFIQADCPDSYSSWAAIQGNLAASYTCDVLNQNAPYDNTAHCFLNNSSSVASVAEGIETCVDVNFSNTNVINPTKKLSSGLAK